jgi:MFS family permease
MAPSLQFLRPSRWLTGLWRNPDFVKLWSSLTLVHFGGQITFIALPLTAALVLNATPFEVGVLTALEALPYPIFGLFAGVLVDRTRKLPVIIACDVGRGLALGAIPFCAWFGVLSMPVLYVAGFFVGLLTVIGWPAYQVFMTERVGREHLVEANAKIGVADSAAQLIGPGIAGALVQWLTAPFAILMDAVSFFVSAWLLRGIPPAGTDGPKRVPRSVMGEIREGLVTIWNIPALRAMVWVLALWQVFRHAFIATIVLFATRELHFSAGLVGALFMGAGLGSLAAAGVVSHLNRRFGMGATMLWGLAGTGLAWLLMGLSSGPQPLVLCMFALGMFVLDLAAMVFFINYLSMRQGLTPDHLLGRVTATMISLTVSTAPIGGLLGGWIAEHYSLRAAVVFAGGGALLLAPLMLVFSPIAKMRELPPHATKRAESATEELAS